MPARRKVRIVYKTPPGQRDKPISLLPLLASLGGIITLIASLTVWSIRQITENRALQTEQVLRQELATKIQDQWTRFSQNVPLKAEWEARRAEIDRRLDEQHKVQDDIEKALREQVILLEQIRVRQENHK